jgi:hypothetical protein
LNDNSEIFSSMPHHLMPYHLSPLKIFLKIQVAYHISLCHVILIH